MAGSKLKAKAIVRTRRSRKRKRSSKRSALTRAVGSAGSKKY